MLTHAWTAPAILTRREIQILCAMANGGSCKDIGHALGISTHTVRKHRSNILAKTGTANATMLVAHARRLGWIAVPPTRSLSMLSHRESEVLSLVIGGFTSKQIARALGISDLTVRKHRENLMRKLRVSTTAALVASISAPEKCR